MSINTPFSRRLFFTLSLPVLLLALVMAGLLGRHLAEQERDAAAADLRRQAQLISLAVAPLLAEGAYPRLAQSVAAASAAGGMRLTVLDAAGRVLADSHADPERMNNHLQRPELLDAIARGSGTAARYSQTLDREFSYYAVPVTAGDRRVGYLRAAVALDELQAGVRASILPVLGYTALGLMAALVIGWLLVARMGRPVARMTRLAQAVARGDFERRVPVDHRAGLGGLAVAINELARHSAQRVAEITADRNRLSAIFAGMVEGVIDVDQQQKILHINEAAATLLGLDARACVNKAIWEAVRIQEIYRALQEAMETRGVVRAQMRLARRSGELVADIYAASLSNADGEPIGAVIVLHDISGLEKLERVRTDFVANASHELKTPITAIRGLAETLLGDDDVDKETVGRFVGRIHQQSIRLSQLVSDLLTISRLESAAGEAEFAPVDFGQVVRRSVQAAESAREAKKQTLALVLPDSRLLMDGDAQTLSQLVDNLVDNAIKYTPEGGAIRVRLQRRGEDLVLEVEDKGIGISPQYQERIFERFYRVDKARSLSLGGTGLGLSIVKNIAEQHGGSVGLRSQPGQGSVFSVRLPLLGEEPMESQAG